MKSRIEDLVFLSLQTPLLSLFLLIFILLLRELQLRKRNNFEILVQT